jgi:hypothetical protein
MTEDMIPTAEEAMARIQEAVIGRLKIIESCLVAFAMQTEVPDHVAACICKAREDIEAELTADPLMKFATEARLAGALPLSDLLLEILAANPHRKARSDA